MMMSCYFEIAYLYTQDCNFFVFFCLLAVVEGTITIEDTDQKRQIQNGDFLVTMENNMIMCTARGWYPLPNITWSVGENKTINERLTIRTNVVEDIVISYLSLEPAFHKQNVTCTAFSPDSYYESSNSIVTLHVYSK